MSEDGIGSSTKWVLPSSSSEKGASPVLSFEEGGAVVSVEFQFKWKTFSFDEKCVDLETCLSPTIKMPASKEALSL